ncbi:MAG: Dyp-type peroxidase [Actinobacteria bacterium]|nr:Dyp-type peroxidase [Actinomycetota bacterium]
MATSQPGIYALGTTAHTHLEFDLRSGVEPVELVTVLAGLDDQRSTINGCNLVVGVRPRMWQQIAPDACPAGAGDFATIEGPDGVVFPATQHDAWVWIASGARDVNFDAARAVVAALADIAELADDVDGFGYHDSRDLSGFVDGTGNPTLDRAAAVAAVAPGGPGAGASIALVQRWIHDLDSLHALPVAEQEKVFGRTKADDVEFDEADMPVDAHIARVEIDGADGTELEIFRRSIPIGDVRGHGLQFVAFARDHAIPQAMLERMAGITDGVKDRLTDFTTAVTGSYYVVPSVEALRRSGRRPDHAV